MRNLTSRRKHFRTSIWHNQRIISLSMCTWRRLAYTCYSIHGIGAEPAQIESPSQSFGMKPLSVQRGMESCMRSHPACERTIVSLIYQSHNGITWREPLARSSIPCCPCLSISKAAEILHDPDDDFLCCQPLLLDPRPDTTFPTHTDLRTPASQYPTILIA